MHISMHSRFIMDSCNSLSFMVRQEGIEPPAYCLEGSCSVLLSYWRIHLIIKML